MTAFAPSVSRGLFSRRLPHSAAKRDVFSFYKNVRERDGLMFAPKKKDRAIVRNVFDEIARAAVDRSTGPTPETGAAASRFGEFIKQGTAPVAWAVGELLDAGFVGDVEATLGRHTRIASLPNSAPRDRVVAQYLADATAIRGQVKATIGLMDVIVAQTTRIEIAPYLQRQEFERLSAEFVANVSVAMKPEDVAKSLPLTADFLAAHEDDLLAACRADVAAQRHNATLGILECLSRGLAHGVLGVATWPGKTVAKYVRCERTVDYDAATKSARRWRVNKEVHLMDAMTLAGVPRWLTPPREVQAVVAAVPEVLRPHLGTIVGTMTHQRRVAWLVDAVEVPDEKVLPLPVIVPDPAIVVGPVVLTGWERPSHEKPRWWERLDCWQARRQ